jgi:hypothetical protein
VFMDSGVYDMTGRVAAARTRNLTVA